MSGILDNVQCGCMENEKRNHIAAAVAGILFFSGWWIIIDIAAQNLPKDQFEGSYYICGVFGTIAVFMINAVSNAVLRGDSFATGFIGARGARLWMFIGFVIAFASLIASVWILFAGYVTNDHASNWYGVSLFFHNLLIFLSGLILKFGRSEDFYG